MAQVHAYLVDPCEIFRQGLARLLGDAACTVIGGGKTLDPRDPVISAGTTPIDLLMLDIESGDNDEKRRALGLVRARHPALKVVALSNICTAETLSRALDWSVDSYLLKEVSTDALAQSLRLVAMGQKIFLANLFSTMKKPEPPKPAPVAAPVDGKGLSRREVEVLRELMSGASNKRIASQLNVSEETVKVHLKSVLRKLRVHNRAQAAVWGMQNGFGAHQPPN
jgi:two-component system, NarL family, nitrate/nitrite response regulator NarL